MFKIHATRDYVLWQSGMNMTWRNEENSCPTQWPWSSGEGSVVGVGSGAGRVGIAPANVSTLVFAYTWPSDASKLTYGGVPAAALGRGAGAASGPAARLATIRAAALAHALTPAEEDAAVDAVLAGKPGLAALLDAYAGAEAAVVARHIRRALAL